MSSRFAVGFFQIVVAFPDTAGFSPGVMSIHPHLSDDAVFTDRVNALIKIHSDAAAAIFETFFEMNEGRITRDEYETKVAMIRRQRDQAAHELIHS